MKILWFDSRELSDAAMAEIDDLTTNWMGPGAELGYRPEHQHQIGIHQEHRNFEQVIDIIRREGCTQVFDEDDVLKSSGFVVWSPTYGFEGSKTNAAKAKIYATKKHAEMSVQFHNRSDKKDWVIRVIEITVK